MKTCIYCGLRSDQLHMFACINGCHFGHRDAVGEINNNTPVEDILAESVRDRVGQLDTLKMLEDINELVETGFVEDMTYRGGFNREFTQAEAKEMAGILGSVYSISHAIHCRACARRYLLKTLQ